MVNGHGTNNDWTSSELYHCARELENTANNKPKHWIDNNVESQTWMLQIMGIMNGKISLLWLTNVARSDSPPRNNWECDRVYDQGQPCSSMESATDTMGSCYSGNDPCFPQSITLRTHCLSLTCIVEEISPAKPAVRGASWAITIRPVLHTDCRIHYTNIHSDSSSAYPTHISCFSVRWYTCITWATVSTSHGIMVLRSSSSQDTPSLSLAIAWAERKTCIWAPYPTSVTSDPKAQHR